MAQIHPAVAITLSMLIAFTVSKIRLIEPQEYASHVKDENGVEGDIDYSISMFGNIDYLRDDEIQIIMPPETNSYGCKPLSHPGEHIKGKYAYLLRRGICPFAKKSLHAKLVS